MASTNGQQFASSFGADSTSGFGSQDWEGSFNFDAYYGPEGTPPQALVEGWVGASADIGGAPQRTIWRDAELIEFAIRNPGQDRFFPTGELMGPLEGVAGSNASPIAEPVEQQTFAPDALTVQDEDFEMVNAGMPMGIYQHFEQELDDQIIPFLDDELYPVAGMSVAQAAPLTGHQQSAVAGPADMARIDSVYQEIQPAQPAGEKKGRNREGQRKGWVQATKHHNSRCEGPLACNPDCMLMERFPRTHAKWLQQRFEVQEVGGARKIVSGLQLNRITKQEGAKAVGELLANGTVNTRSKTTGGVLADEFWQE